ncbi:hypothetical protein FN846DRAFT_151408 [Sphaerosporella brunnea]|uniref:Uncharacterized protein n=1 Tax=Sphaerosporella brunnea TaxID=1250544 RepID=A0A5J5EPW7_9PEZI|nr:hypothetical protein FN846DRAFT_151408 [Sphaerosporella brunnea]
MGLFLVLLPWRYSLILGFSSDLFALAHVVLRALLSSLVRMSLLGIVVLLAHFRAFLLYCTVLVVLFFLSDFLGLFFLPCLHSVWGDGNGEWVLVSFYCACFVFFLLLGVFIFSLFIFSSSSTSSFFLFFSVCLENVGMNEYITYYYLLS